MCRRTPGDMAWLALLIAVRIAHGNLWASEPTESGDQPALVAGRLRQMS